MSIIHDANGVAFGPNNPMPTTEVVRGAAIQYQQITVTTAQSITRAAGAVFMEIYVESGSVRVRTDGQAATSTLGLPIGAGFSETFNVASLSIIATTGSSVVEVVHR